MLLFVIYVLVVNTKLEVIYSILTFPTARTTRFSKTRHSNVLIITCFIQPGEVRIGVEFLSKGNAILSFRQVRLERKSPYGNLRQEKYRKHLIGVPRKGV